MDISYILNHLGEDRENYFNSVAPPIIQTSNFCFETVDKMRDALSNEFSEPFYTRGYNPTTAILRKKLAALEGADDALVFGSGSAAIAAAVMNTVKGGDHVICVDRPYSWTNKLLNKMLASYGVATTMTDGTSVDNFRKAIQSNTRLIFLESPNSMTFEQQDIAEIAALAKANNIVTIVDNSYATPLLQQPIFMGADMTVHSASKYLGGHSDIVAGVLCGSSERIQNIFASEFMTLGGILSPHDTWLMLRGLRTLQIRMERSSQTAARVVEFLENHPKIEKVYYPFSKNNPQFELSKKQMKQGGGMFSIEVKADGIEQMEKFCNSLRRFLLACSWGSYESLIFPACTLYASQNYGSTTLPWNFARLYTGLEDADLLIEDIGQALDKMG